MDFNNFRGGEFTLADAVGVRTDAGSVGYGVPAGFNVIRLPWTALACPDARADRRHCVQMSYIRLWLVDRAREFLLHLKNRLF